MVSEQIYDTCILVYSQQWPETVAITNLYAQISPDIQILACFSPKELIEQLSVHVTSSVILGMHPHESIFLLFSLQNYLQRRRILFWGEKFYFSDRMIPFYLLNQNNDILFHEYKGNSLSHAMEKLSYFISSKTYENSTNFYTTVVPAVSHANELIFHINMHLYKMLSRHGVGEYSGVILCMLSSGLSTKQIADLLNICKRTVSAHKYKGLSRLGIEPGSYNLHRGILVKADLQLFEFGGASIKRGCHHSDKRSIKKNFFTS